MAIEYATAGVDWDQLKSPIPGDNPAGESLRYEGTYDRIQESRKHDNPELSQGVWESKLKQADWKQADKLALEALYSRTKDIQIAAWWMEAALHMRGYAGARQGLEVLHCLLVEFWDHVHPEIDDGDLDARVRPFEWVNEKLSIKLKLVPLTKPESKDLKVYTFADWEVGTKNENEIRKNPENKGLLESQMNQSLFFASADSTPVTFYRAVRDDVEASLTVLREIESLLDEACGKQSPSLIKFRQGLETVHRLTIDILGRRPEEEPAPDALEDVPENVEDHEEGHEERYEGDFMPEEDSISDVNEHAAGADENTAPAEAPKASAPAPGSSGIRSRAEAYRILQQVADYLEEIEPHSPTPHLVRRAVAWGDMKLEDLLLEIVRDDNDLRFIYDLLGLQQKYEEPDDD